MLNYPTLKDYLGLVKLRLFHISWWKYILVGIILEDRFNLGHTVTITFKSK